MQHMLLFATWWHHNTIFYSVQFGGREEEPILFQDFLQVAAVWLCASKAKRYFNFKELITLAPDYHSMNQFILCRLQGPMVLSFLGLQSNIST